MPSAINTPKVQSSIHVNSEWVIQKVTMTRSTSISGNYIGVFIDNVTHRHPKTRPILIQLSISSPNNNYIQNNQIISTIRARPNVLQKQ